VAPLERWILRQAFGCAVVIVHHCGHDNNKLRDHTAPIGAADAEPGLNILRHIFGARFGAPKPSPFFDAERPRCAPIPS
jgi:hypothetical protein